MTECGWGVLRSGGHATRLTKGALCDRRSLIDYWCLPKRGVCYTPGVWPVCLVFAVFVGSAGLVSGAQIQDSVLSKFYAPDEIPASFPIDATAYRQALSSVAKFGDASGVVIEGGYFVTARHVAEYARRKNLHAIIAQDDNGQWREVPIEETPFTSHSLPYDIAIYIESLANLAACLPDCKPKPRHPVSRPTASDSYGTQTSRRRRIESGWRWAAWQTPILQANRSASTRTKMT
jgi:hypothetical protein